MALRLILLHQLLTVAKCILKVMRCGHMRRNHENAWYCIRCLPASPFVLIIGVILLTCYYDKCIGWRKSIWIEIWFHLGVCVLRRITKSGERHQGSIYWCEVLSTLCEQVEKIHGVALLDESKCHFRIAEVERSIFMYLIFILPRWNLKKAKKMKKIWWIREIKPVKISPVAWPESDLPRSET